MYMYVVRICIGILHVWISRVCIHTPYNLWISHCANVLYTNVSYVCILYVCVLRVYRYIIRVYVHYTNVSYVCILYVCVLRVYMYIIRTYVKCVHTYQIQLLDFTLCNEKKIQKKILIHIYVHKETDK